MVTAMVSPKARANPKKIEPKIPSGRTAPPPERSIPTGGAQRQRRLALIAWHFQQGLSRDRDDEWQVMIDRITPAVQITVAKRWTLEKRNKSERVLEKRVPVLPQSGISVKRKANRDDAWYGGQKLNEKRKSGGDASRRQFRQKDSRAYSYRRNHRQGQERRHHRSVDERQGSEVARHRVPIGADQETETRTWRVTRRIGPKVPIPGTLSATVR